MDHLQIPVFFSCPVHLVSIPGCDEYTRQVQRSSNVFRVLPWVVWVTQRVPTSRHVTADVITRSTRGKLAGADRYNRTRGRAYDRVELEVTVTPADGGANDRPLTAILSTKSGFR